MVPVVLPKWNDPRLKLTVVIVSLQVLGQTVLGFKVSIAQILLTILACAVVEIVITYFRQGALVWPASALLTGNSVAFILRTPGTRHGDWWSLNGIEYFIGAALLGLLSKYLITIGGRHLYNPSNLGLVAVFLVAGAASLVRRFVAARRGKAGRSGPPLSGGLRIRFSPDVSVTSMWCFCRVTARAIVSFRVN